MDPILARAAMYPRQGKQRYTENPIFLCQNRNFVKQIHNNWFFKEKVLCRLICTFSGLINDMRHTWGPRFLATSWIEKILFCEKCPRIPLRLLFGTEFMVLSGRLKINDRYPIFLTNLRDSSSDSWNSIYVPKQAKAAWRRTPVTRVRQDMQQRSLTYISGFTDLHQYSQRFADWLMGVLL